MQRVARAKSRHLTSASLRAAKKKNKRKEKRKRKNAKGSRTRKEGDCGEEAWPTAPSSSSSERASYTGSAAVPFRGEDKVKLPLPPPALVLPSSSPNCARARVLLLSPVVRETRGEEPGGGGGGGASSEHRRGRREEG